MAIMLYINPDDDGTRATELGCGWMPSVPAGYDADPPCVIVHGNGQQFTIPDDGTLTHAQVYTVAQPILDAEQAAQAATVTAEQTVTVDPQALTDATAALNSATTVAALRKAVAAALNLLNPTQ